MRHQIIPYSPQLKERARELRRKMTLSEILLWKEIKGKQLCGYDFDRQRPVGQRIVDFYCRELNLAVDVDGSVHDFTRKEDNRRQREIEALGITLLRFWNYDVKNDICSVLKQIEVWIRGEERRRGWPRREAKRKPTPNPSKGGERLADVACPAETAAEPRSARAGSPPGRGQGWVDRKVPTI